MSKIILSEVSFGSAKIQKLRRVALDANLLHTLGLSEGDCLEVSLLVETGEIRLKKPSETTRKAPSKKGEQR